MKKKVKTIRELSEENPKIKRLHEQWAMSVGSILEQRKNDWNFESAVRNNCRNFIDELLKLL